MSRWTKSRFFGGHVGLDFLNTVLDDGKTRRINAIPDWETALDWASVAEILSEREAKSLARSVDSRNAEQTLRELYAFRELAWSVFSEVAANRRPKPRMLGELDGAIKWAYTLARLTPQNGAFTWYVRIEDLGPDVIRARAALAVFNLMMRDDFARLRECARCTGMFLDLGRGVGRRWCRMKTCGNRAKTERFRSKPAQNI